MADEYISKQRAKDLMGCCLASAKANYKEETDVFKRAKFQCYVETIEAMIDVVGAVEAANVQPVRCGEWEIFHQNGKPKLKCTNCHSLFDIRTNDKHICIYPKFCEKCGADMRGEQK